MQSRGRSSGYQGNKLKKGPSEEDVVRTKSMQEVNGIPRLPFHDEDGIENENLWITKRKKKGKHVDEDEFNGELIQFSAEDTKEEVEYWNQAVYCFVLGANPPWNVLHGYIHRIWAKYGIDKVSFLPNGVFLVRFKTNKDKDAVLQAGYHMFDNKPLIVRSWTEESEITKEEVKVVPAWIRICDLPLRFWGKCLPRIAGLVGKFVKADQATAEKTRLGFARVMIELNVGAKFPKVVKFLDEKGSVITLDIEYEWKPIICDKCKGIGHDGGHCKKIEQGAKKKPVAQKIWKPVIKIAETSTVTVTNTQTEADAQLDKLGTKQGQELTETPVVELITPIKQKDQENQQVMDTECTPPQSSNGMNYLKALGGSILQYDVQFIHTKVQSRITQKSFYLTMIYAFNEGNDRVHLWTKLEEFAQQCHGPWALAGDFNTVLCPDERLGGNTKEADMDDFIRCMEICGMTDIAATGALYTWNNKQEANTRIYSRLDRFLINQEWMNWFPDMVAHFYPEGIFDHCPCVVSNCKTGSPQHASFKYFNMWGQAPNFLDRVKEEWTRSYESHKMFAIVKKLKALKPVLKGLNSECYSDIENRTVKAVQGLDKIQQQLAQDPANSELVSQEITLLAEVRSLTAKQQGIAF
ncbi:uncharacterized protein LOC141590344 [Silene latifolia]|uniref:uncharacterized protein LOC141590344 n=1 Tax=Silene latifolia TaxID=37657 RepID=UPI003D770305